MPYCPIGPEAAVYQAVKWLVQQSMAYGEYVSVTPFFNWVTYGTFQQLFAKVEAGSATFLSESR
jgi:hypothetical protein